VVGVIGPQGAGKSTVLSVLAGAGPFTDSRFVYHGIGRLVLSMYKPGQILLDSVIIFNKCLGAGSRQYCRYNKPSWVITVEEFQ